MSLVLRVVDIMAAAGYHFCLLLSQLDASDTAGDLLSITQVQFL